jgi:sec-independent protein translocase protein TatC
MRDLLVILTPIVVVLLALGGLVSLENLKRNRAYALILAFVLSAAVTTAPDVVSMSIMAVSMYLLYELGLICARLLFKM